MGILSVFMMLLIKSLRNNALRRLFQKLRKKLDKLLFFCYTSNYSEKNIGAK